MKGAPCDGRLTDDLRGAIEVQDLFLFMTTIVLFFFFSLFWGEIMTP